ncbi:MAG: translation initiation factor IF-2 [Candidatus Woesearchaeota archaeon]
MLRSVICAVLGHVDHGKSSILDRIRGTAIVKSEPGLITQAIGASIIPIDVIKNICGSLLSAVKMDLAIPGLLLIDTPGHAAFTNLRKRGGNLADIAILVIDINDGAKPQTLEAIDILKHYKTPFIVAANKIDMLNGWRASQESCALLKNIQQQDENVVTAFETKIYNIVASLSGLGFQSERFDRVEDYTKQVAIVPCSAKTGDGIPELLMVIAGLAQKFLETSLTFSAHGAAKGTILEVKKDKGLGTTLDVIIYDGTLKVGDEIVIGALGEPIVTKIKALFEPLPLNEMRDKKAKYSQVKEVTAATGVKISAIGIDEAVAGMPLRSVRENLDKAKEAVMSEVQEVSLETSQVGIVAKADSLGSLEAIMIILREKEIPVKKLAIGPITHKDILDAEGSYEKDPLLSVVLGFNVGFSTDVSEKETGNAKIITGNVIYSIMERLEQWRDEEKKKQQQRELSRLTMPSKILVLKGYVFRASNPAVVGVEVLGGNLAVDTPLMKDGAVITTVRSIQLEKENITTAAKGKQVAVSLDNVTVGRQIREGDTLYSAVPEEDFRKLKELKKNITLADVEILKEIAEIMRKDNPVWGF